LKFTSEGHQHLLCNPDWYAGHLPYSICNILDCPNQIELVENNNNIAFQQDYTAFSGQHFACLAIMPPCPTSLTSPPHLYNNKKLLIVVSYHGNDDKFVQGNISDDIKRLN
jgi:hypothetical protein